jgi:beta-fructofuranosidase
MLALGSGARERGGMILLYTSQDLRHWEYLHPLVESSPSGMKSADPVHSGDMWECPDFFPLGEKHVLLISTKGNVRWKVGTYEKQRFTPEKEGVVDWGSYYAAKTMIDRDGTRILWGWISETRSDAELTEAGWAGAMSLPRVMSLNAQDEFVTEVASVARRLRTKDSPMNLASKKLADIRIHDLCAELDLHLHPRSDEFVLTLQSEGGAPFATISCAAQNGGREIRVNNLKAPLSGGAGAPVHLHIYLDGSVLELFANQATSMTARVYQAPDGPLRLAVKGSVEVERVSAWQMAPISKDRLTGSACG